MRIGYEQLENINNRTIESHNNRFDNLLSSLNKDSDEIQGILDKVASFQVAIPSWALGAGGTRFGRFSYHGEPSSLEQKIEDIGILHRLSQSAGAISLHIPWDIPKDYNAIKDLAFSHNLVFDAVNSNTFQDHPGSNESYKYGSLSSSNQAVREQAIAHNQEVIKIGENLGSESITIWLADGSNFPGQTNFQSALLHTQNSLKEIYAKLPDNWKMFIEYKPYEPNFYSTVIQDWGTSFLLANACGDKAYTLVDLGHHLPNTNIEQIVSTLMLQGKLGGFHFNDSKYGDDDLTAGCIKPYSLFLIFNSLVYGMQNNPQNPYPAWMIDASHNVKDPLEDLLQSLEAILEAYTKALLVDQKTLEEAQKNQDVVLCQEILQDAYRTDVRPIIERARLMNKGALNPIQVYRELKVREKLIKERGKNSVATGL